MRMNVSFDGAAYSRQVRAYVKETVRPALDQAVLYLAKAARDRLRAATDIYFDRPTDWTRMAFRARPLSGRSKAEALVYVMPSQARYLGIEITGGDRVAGDYATLPEGVLVPGRDAALDEHGNLPRGYVSQKELEGAKWVYLTPGKPPMLILPGRGKPQIFAVIIERAHIQARFPFHDIVERAVFDNAPQALAKFLK